MPSDRGLLDLAKLGLLAKDEKLMRQLLALPHGLIVVTGPTGSGKTTTLATVLSLLNEPSRKILTVEDPVEYEIQGESITGETLDRPYFRRRDAGFRPPRSRCHHGR